MAPANELPPKGPPGPKGRVLRAAVKKALALLEEKGAAGADEAKAILADASTRYDANEA
jgi:hypothetical protein